MTFGISSWQVPPGDPVEVRRHARLLVEAGASLGDGANGLVSAGSEVQQSWSGLASDLFVGVAAETGSRIGVVGQAVGRLADSLNGYANVLEWAQDRIRWINGQIEQQLAAAGSGLVDHGRISALNAEADAVYRELAQAATVLRGAMADLGGQMPAGDLSDDAHCSIVSRAHANLAQEGQPFVPVAGPGVGAEGVDPVQLAALLGMALAVWATLALTGGANPGLYPSSATVGGTTGPPWTIVGGTSTAPGVTTEYGYVGGNTVPPFTIIGGTGTAPGVTTEYSYVGGNPVVPPWTIIGGTDPGPGLLDGLGVIGGNEGHDRPRTAADLFASRIAAAPTNFNNYIWTLPNYLPDAYGGYIY